METRNHDAEMTGEEVKCLTGHRFKEIDAEGNTKCIILINEVVLGNYIIVYCNVVYKTGCLLFNEEFCIGERTEEDIFMFGQHGIPVDEQKYLIDKDFVKISDEECREFITKSVGGIYKAMCL